MLANGAKLYHKATSTGTYTELTGLKEIPDFGVEPEKVENTCLTDTHKMYEMGIGDLPDMTYKFKYKNTASTDPWRILKGYESAGTVAYFKEELKDGTTTEYQAQVSLKRTGGGVNGVIEFEATMYVQSAFSVTDPA